MGTPQTLDALRDALINEDPAGLDLKHGKIDWSSLPAFGGDEPDNTELVWPWDRHRLLVGTCADDLQIVSREESAS